MRRHGKFYWPTACAHRRRLKAFPEADLREILRKRLAKRESLFTDRKKIIRIRTIEMRLVFDIPIPERLQLLTRGEGWFGRAPREFKEPVLGAVDWRTCLAGEALYRVIDESGDVIGIVDGCIDVYSRFAPGENPLLHIGHEGLWFGVGPLLSGQRRRATVVARTDALLARLPSRAMRQLLAAEPEWWRVLGTGALEYGDYFAAAYAEMLISDSARRCAATLLRITGLRPLRRARPDRASVVVTQAELARLVNVVSRTTLVQILQQLERNGLIEQGYRTLRVRDANALEAIAAQV